MKGRDAYMPREKKKNARTPVMQEAKRMLVLTNGRTYRITGENGKYYLCEGAQFRKSNPRIRSVGVEESSMGMGGVPHGEC